MQNEPPSLVSVSLRLPRDLVEALDREAVALDRAAPNRSQVVRAALERQLRVGLGKPLTVATPAPEEVAA